MDTWEVVKDYDNLRPTYGIYAFTVDDVVVYIGRTKSMWTRIRRHPVLKLLREQVAEVCVRISYSLDDYDREKALIQEYLPHYNCEHRNKWPDNPEYVR